jgi:hypothetical protein
MIRLMDILMEAMSPTERTRLYNKRHPDKVRAHLRKTTEDRVERNRARREAVKRNGKQKMKNKDVHHVYGTKKKVTRTVPKDHGPGHK